MATAAISQAAAWKPRPMGDPATRGPCRGVAACAASAPRGGYKPLWSESLTLDPLALHLAGAANGFRGLAGAALGRLLIVPPQLHLAENPLPLHLLLERLQRLVDIVVTDENLHLAACSFLRWRPRPSETHKTIPLPVVRAGGVPYNMRPRPRQCGFSIPPSEPATLGISMAILKVARMGHPVLIQR